VAVYPQSCWLPSAARLGREGVSGHHCPAGFLCVHAPHRREYTCHERDRATDNCLFNDEYELDFDVDNSDRGCAAGASDDDVRSGSAGLVL